MKVIKIKVNDNMSEEAKAAGTELTNVGGNAKKNPLKLGEVKIESEKGGRNNYAAGSEFSEIQTDKKEKD